MRYFVKIAYKGTAYSGWQIQPNAPTIQQTIEEAMSLILATPIKITGCGRTDAGVHASTYYFHFDFNDKLPKAFIHRINKFLSKDLVFYEIKPVATDAHARFNAYYRAYEYHLTLWKNPFLTDLAWFYPLGQQINVERLNAAAALLLEYKEFAPFCKTNSDAKTMICDLKRSEWIFDASRQQWVYHIAANRFLRGMVRLIVGMCLNVSTGKINLEEVRKAMDNQTPLKKSYSVPSQGLYLSEVKYFEL